MTLLVDIHDQNWMNEQAFSTLLNGGIAISQVRFYPNIGALEDIAMLVCDRLRPGLVKQLPNLKLVQKLGAGVETIIDDADISDNIRIARLKPAIAALQMAQFCVACVLPDVYNFKFHQAHQRNSQWRPKAPQLTADMTVSVLGLGHIGRAVATLFQVLGFRVIGWSRTEKVIAGIDCRWGLNAINSVLAEPDYVICVLPSTADTINLFDANRFKAMKQGSVIINIGRGTLIVERDLMAALDTGHLAHAVLDVVQQEPLAADSLLWKHPHITITPHISGWHLDGLDVVVANYNALMAGLPLTHEVNRQHGY